MAASTPDKWLLSFSSKTYGWTGALANGDGRPWGDGTWLASREGATGSGPTDPWDPGCKVTPIVGGYAAMTAIRNSLDDALTEAGKLSLPDENAHVYIADWRFNALRDVSGFTNPWILSLPNDPTAIGYVLRLMQKGIYVRIMLWYPTWLEEHIGSFQAHAEDHFYVATLVRNWSDNLKTSFPNATQPLGIVALDARVAEPQPPAATHHQKMMVIRVGQINVAFCGGVDLAYTRRDAPIMSGDWQSGEGIPDAQLGWPGISNYGNPITGAAAPVDKQTTDLPEEVYGDGKINRQIWHDQHLKLEGPIVSTIEAQFDERWIDTGKVATIGSQEVPGDRSPVWFTGEVTFSTGEAYDAKSQQITPLPTPVTVTDKPGTAWAQMWRTIPWRTRSGPPFTRAEFTAMAGIAHACQTAGELIWIFDQYFWSLPLARLLNYQLVQKPTLNVIVILPPHADGDNIGADPDPKPSSVQVATHQARARALDALTAGLGSNGQYSRVAVYNLWHPGGLTGNRGIYCHAKAQTYDGNLLACGSCNLNRRSFTCDSEIVCAVLDPPTVANHQHALWDWLFQGLAWPTDANNNPLDLTKTGSGVAFFRAFTKAAAVPGKTYLTPDKWWQGSYRLPNGVLRDQDSPTALFPIIYDTAMDPLALPVGAEGSICQCQGGGPDVVGRLDQIVYLLEACYYQDQATNQVVWPYRRDPVADVFSEEPTWL